MRPLLRASLCFSAACVFVGATPRSALAQSDFPPIVQEILGLDTAPGCELCHNGAQSKATATQDFVVALQAYGLDFGQNIEADQIRDSVTAANAANDPAVVKVKGGVAAKYGCIEQNSSIAGSTSTPPRIASMVMAGLVACVLLLRRRR
jgi:hypothetical protein